PPFLPTIFRRGGPGRVGRCRVLTGEKTLAELSRELDISPSVIRNWKRHYEAGATAAVAANEDVVPVSQLREAYARIRELERALGRKTMEVEILQAAQEVVKKNGHGPPAHPRQHENGVGRVQPAPGDVEAFWSDQAAKKSTQELPGPRTVAMSTPSKVVR